MTLCIGGPIVGIIVGFLFHYWIVKSSKDGITIVSITFINCFFLFYCCEYLRFNISGILAVVLSAIILSYKGKIKTI